jgi:adenine-specific DNA-methyltransferase
MPTLDWIGKQAVVRHHAEVPFHLLKEDPDLSCGGEAGAGNLIVQGDNLKALKALLPHYAGQVKCIFIDPPYNTGNEGWVYNDNVNSPEIKRWLESVVGKEGEDLTRHDKWLCMMYPRLMLLKRFLREDGAIFVSLDDNEIGPLRLIMDEIFGAQNFVATIIWQKKYAVSNDHKSIAPMHDYVLVYQRTGSFRRNLLPRTEVNDKQYKFTDDKGLFRVSDYTCNKTADERPNLYYPVKNPNTGQEVWPKRTRVWGYSREVFDQHEQEGLIWWGKEGKASVPAFKRYRDSLKGGGGTVPPTLWTHEFADHNDGAKKELREIFGAQAALDFFTPKPTRLIQRILQIASESDSLILDSFAGSGTTGHAVLKQNAEDGGRRRFILVEMDENIAQNITAERVQRVSQGYKNAKNESVSGLGSGFRFAKLGKTLFDESGAIREDVKFRELAEFVYFHHTGSPMPKGWKSSPLLGIVDGRAIYLLYNGILGDRSIDGGNVLTAPVLANLPAHDGPKTIYAAACRLGPNRLERERIQFKQTPYGLKVD